MTYRYTYVGDTEEIFPLLPVASGPVTRVMNRGDVVECSEPVAHARLVLDEGTVIHAEPDPPVVADEAVPEVHAA